MYLNCTNSYSRPFGFRAYVGQTYEAPDGVRNYLCRNYHHHQIPIGDRVNIEQFASRGNLGFNKFFANSHEVLSLYSF